MLSVLSARSPILWFSPTPKASVWLVAVRSPILSNALLQSKRTLVLGILDKRLLNY
ncbi:MAG: hypothetical protein KME27_30925 [Lyngbya sp. HA4199-MV5]|nr:hypothetical protein [Lyngbya sp. HA4199-MV5]